MKVLITGAAGFLGSHLADWFVKNGDTVVGIDNLIGGYRDNVNQKVDFHELNLIEYEKILLLFEGVDLVYHCAATAYEGLSVFSPRLVTQNIVDASIATITASIAQKVVRFVFCSSMARYGAQRVPFTEEMVPLPQDPYGIGKVAAENLLVNLARVHGMEYVIAVPHNIIGPRQKYDDPYRNVAAIMINRMLQGEQPIIYGDGTQKRCFSFVQDDLHPLVKLAIAPVVGEVINIGPDEEFVSINELAEVIGRILDFKVKPIYVKDRPQEVKLANCSADKARRLLGYQTTYTLEQGLREMAAYVKKRGPKPFDYHLPLEIVNEKTPDTWKDRLI
ncbi:NAD-dependent epimerase/dehydratase family protein [Candidatus Kaiserbacteria bacterium]|nr:NAD-dependent epimerase/dehydratase family protein [Candidatus Kaiserbacteria bacterium]